MPASRAPKRSSGPLRVGVLGQGRSGLSIHCKWFEQSPRKFKIVAIADLLADRRRQAVERRAAFARKRQKSRVTVQGFGQRGLRRLGSSGLGPQPAEGQRAPGGGA